MPTAATSRNPRDVIARTSPVSGRLFAPTRLMFTTGNPLARHPVELDREQRASPAMPAEDVGGIERRAREDALECLALADEDRGDGRAVRRRECGAIAAMMRMMFAFASTGCAPSTPLSMSPMRASEGTAGNIADCGAAAASSDSAPASR